MNIVLPKSGLEMGKIDSRLPKTAQVYELLREAIIFMRLVPGAPIIEKDICESLDISRTPLREAIIRLASESLVLVRPGGGTYVNLIVSNQVLQGQIVRDTLEARLVRLAAKQFTADRAPEFEIALFQQKLAHENCDIDEFFRLDNQFHKLICECTSFPNSWHTIHGAIGQLDRIRRYALPKDDHSYRSLKEHALIYQYIKENNAESAAAAFQSHIDRLFDEVDQINQLNPEWISNEAKVSVDSIR